MSEESTDKFDAILKRMLDAKPLSKKHISEKIKAYKAVKKSAKEAYTVRKTDK